MTSKSTTYDANALQVLKGLEAVRKRPGMYIGSTDARGLQHCMWEIIDNAVDEAIAGHCTHIDVILHDDGSVEVRDNGRGIPTGINARTGLTGVELVFTELHAGGKFGGSGYEVSGGLHGVGASVVNALSTRLDVEVDQSGATHTMSFHRGDPGVFDTKGNFTKQSGLTKLKGAKPTTTGTRVRYWADKSIFLADADIDLERTYERARQTAFLVPGLELVVTDQRKADAVTTETFCFEGGTKDFVEFIAPDMKVTDPVVITGSATFEESVPVLNDDGHMVTQVVTRNLSVDIALRWGTGYESIMRSFVNIIATPKGGTHVTGFERAVTKAMNEIALSTKAVKPSDEAPVKEDILEGLSAVICVRLAEPQFEGQTKEILGTAAATKIVADIVAEGLKTWAAAKANKDQVKRVTEKIATAAKTRRALRLQKETIRRKNALESSSLPAKLADCRSDDLERCEIFIVEGDSAMGTCKAARDSEVQALLPIRGKILNTLRATEKQMLDNAECAAIITALGAGSGKSFDETSLRYGKLIILADADVDGAHIRTLLLTLCFRYMYPLLAAGRVYAAVPPLRRITLSNSGEHIYTYTDEEHKDKVTELEAAGKKIKEIQRYKGLGEMDADQLAETTLDPTRRMLRRITLEDAEAAAAMFEMLMGSNVGPRRDFIVDNALTLDREQLDI
jgi:DNA gyrase subunit B